MLYIHVYIINSCVRNKQVQTPETPAVICFLIWPCDMTVNMTYLVSHSSSLSCHTQVIIKDILGVHNKYKTTLVC